MEVITASAGRNRKYEEEDRKTVTVCYVKEFLENPLVHTVAVANYFCFFWLNNQMPFSTCPNFGSDGQTSSFPKIVPTEIVSFGHSLIKENPKAKTK